MGQNRSTWRVSRSAAYQSIAAWKYSRKAGALEGFAGSSAQLNTIENASIKISTSSLDLPTSLIALEPPPRLTQRRHGHLQIVKPELQVR